MEISVIIVSWNSLAVIADCINSLLAEASDVEIEIIVVDNDSDDGTREFIKRDFPGVTLLVNEINQGFAAANNQASLIARGDFLLLINPDARITNGSLRVLFQYIREHTEMGCLGPKILNLDGSFQRSCWKGYPDIMMALSDAFYLWKLPFSIKINRSEYLPNQLKSTTEVDHLLGACMLIRRSTWDDVGGFDDKFFLFLEETDWCYRAKLKGWVIAYHPGGTVVHLGEHSVNQNPERNIPQFYSSYILFYRKHHPGTPIKVFLLRMIIATAAGVRILLWGLRRIQRSQGNTNPIAMQRGYFTVLKSVFSL